MTALPRSSLAQSGEAPRRRVLVAEDNERLAELVAATLRAAGYEVAVAHDGYRALALLREQGFDALLTDWMMPGLTGDLVAVRARREQPELALLLMTAAVGADALAVPWTAVIRKPFALDLLLDAVRSATAASSASGQTAFSPVA